MIPITLLRALIAVGISDEALTVLAEYFGAAPTTAPVTSAVRRSVTVTTPNAIPATRAGVPRTVYSAVPRMTTERLDRMGVTGNNRIVADYILSADHAVDSRELRDNVLRDKLHDDGTNKAIESAVDKLKTAGIIVGKRKPHTPIVTPRPNAVRL